MPFFLWSHDFKTDLVGAVARDICPHCGNATTFLLGKNRSVTKAYFVIPVMKRTKGHLVICKGCGISTQLPKRWGKELVSEVKNMNERAETPTKSLVDLGIGEGTCSKCKTLVGAFDQICEGCGKVFK